MEFKAKAGLMDILLTAFTDIFLLLAIYMRLKYGFKVELMIVLLAICGGANTWSLLHLPKYQFGPAGLTVKEHFPLKDTYIPYGNIETMRVSGNFMSALAKASHKVVLKYMDPEKKMLITLNCMPDDVYGFVEALQKYSGKRFMDDA